MTQSPKPDATEVVKAVLGAYHTTRLRDADPVEHVLSKPRVQAAFKAYCFASSTPEPVATTKAPDAVELSIRARRFGSCPYCGGANGHDYALGGVFCMNPKCSKEQRSTLPTADAGPVAENDVKAVLAELEGYTEPETEQDWACVRAMQLIQALYATPAPPAGDDGLVKRIATAINKAAVGLLPTGSIGTAEEEGVFWTLLAQSALEALTRTEGEV